MEALVLVQERSDSTNLVTTTIHAAGICCPSEEPIIKGLLKDLPGTLSGPHVYGCFKDADIS